VRKNLVVTTISVLAAQVDGNECDRDQKDCQKTGCQLEQII